jgi:phytoene dehydrogenase-like protein
MKTAIVIGAGFGGLALAIRLQSAGVQTTIVESRDKPGGRGYFWERDGFTFDVGSSVMFGFSDKVSDTEHRRSTSTQLKFDNKVRNMTCAVI